MKVLLQRLKSNQSSPRVRKGPHARTHLLWQILLFSLPLDPLITLSISPRIPGQLAIHIAILHAAVILPFLAQHSLHVSLSKLRNFHLRSLDHSTSFLSLVVFAFLGLGVALKMALVFNLPRAVAAIFLLILFPAVVKQIRDAHKQSKQDRELFSKNPWVKVQRWEQQMIIFVTLPLILARLIGVYGALALPPENEGEIFQVTFTLVSALFLGMLQPNRSNFVGMCKKCKHPVPIVFQDVGSCLQCDGMLRASYHAWIHGQPFQLSQPTVTTKNETPSTKISRKSPKDFKQSVKKKLTGR